MELIYWSVCSSCRRGRDGVKGVGSARCEFTELENIEYSDTSFKRILQSIIFIKSKQKNANATFEKIKYLMQKNILKLL